MFAVCLKHDYCLLKKLIYLNSVIVKSDYPEFSNQEKMKSNDAFFAIVVIAAVGISLYRKYYKKGKEKQSVQKPASTGSLHSVRDDYEPYSGKYPGSGSGKQDA